MRRPISIGLGVLGAAAAAAAWFVPHGWPLVLLVSIAGLCGVLAALQAVVLERKLEQVELKAEAAQESANDAKVWATIGL